jgi:integration host factor subunit beta
MATITKKDLAIIISGSIGCSKIPALQIADSLFEVMRDTLIKGNRIEIRGFGTLEVRDTKAKPNARNPRTGDIVFVPARRKVHFKPGKELKEGLIKKLPEL